MKPRMTGQGRQLMIYLGESDRYKDQPLYHAIIKLFKEAGLAGATVLRGLEGFSADSKIDTANILRLSEDLPLVIIAVDTRENIDKVLPRVREIVQTGMVTVQDVEII